MPSKNTTFLCKGAKIAQIRHTAQPARDAGRCPGGEPVGRARRKLPKDLAPATFRQTAGSPRRATSQGRKGLPPPPCGGAICQNSDFILLSRRDCLSLSATKHHILILKTTHLMLKTILAIAGKPGLYRLVSRGKNMLIVESVSDKKRFPAYGNEKIMPCTPTKRMSPCARCWPQ